MMASSRGSSGDAEAHFLLLPFAEQGHVNPMLSIASHLVAVGCRVTFVNAPGRKQRSAGTKGAVPDERSGEEVPERLRFVTPKPSVEPNGDDVESVDGQPDKPPDKPPTVSRILAGPEKTMESLVTSLLCEPATPDSTSCVPTHPISGVICDFYMWKWVSRITRAHGLPLAVLNASSATFFYMLYLRHKRNYTEIKDMLVNSDFGLPTTEFFDGLVSSMNTPAENEETTNFFCNLFEGFDEVAAIVLVNSFHRLEAPLLPFLNASPLNFAFVGPCFPVWNTERVGMCNAMAQSAWSSFEEEQSCLLWLDKQKKGSVLYVSFGSVAILRDEAQMEEIAAGVEKSGYNFLWVVRPGSPEDMQPPKAFRERFMRRKGEKGIFVAWAPQKTVLQHRAVGGFLTHSGWNSTIESVTSGVPLLSLPFYGDQIMNANMVHWYWKIGVRLEFSTEFAKVRREDVEKGVHMIMQDYAISQRVAEYQQVAQAAIVDGPQQFVSFVSSMINKAA